MILNIDLVLKLLPILASLIGKISTALTTVGPVSIEEEIKALEACRLRPSEDIIAEADKT